MSTNNSKIYDLAIVGGGPAGAGAVVYASRKRLSTVFITKDWLGQSHVSEKIENWIGTPAISGMDLSKSLETHAKTYGKDIVDFQDGELCVSISKSLDIFQIKTDKGEYKAKTILITSGSKRRTLDIKGAKEFEHKGLTYCATCDGPMYADMDVVVVGGGNAAFETASQLLAYCKSVTLINRSDTFRADPVTVDAVSKHKNMKILKNAVPKEVKGDKFVKSFVYTDSITGKDIEINTNGIFVEIGALPNTDFVKGVVDQDPTGHIKVDPKTQRTSLSGIWSAGDCTDGLYHQNNIAVGDAVKALEDIYLFVKLG